MSLGFYILFPEKMYYEGTRSSWQSEYADDVRNMGDIPPLRNGSNVARYNKINNRVPREHNVYYDEIDDYPLRNRHKRDEVTYPMSYAHNISFSERIKESARSFENAVRGVGGENERVLFLSSFSNSGNTCFINSVLQLILSSPYFLVSMRNIKVEIGEDTFAHQLSRLAAKKWSTASEVIIPKSFGELVFSRFSMFSKGNQEDAHELLVNVLDKIDEETKTPLIPFVPTNDHFVETLRHLETELEQSPESQTIKNSLINLKRDNINRYTKYVREDYLSKVKETSVTKELCGGRFLWKTECKCGNISLGFTPFTSISQPIDTSEVSTTLMKCLSSILCPEIISDYECGLCKTRQDARRTSCIDKFPPLLNIHLKRFKVDISTYTLSKIDTCVNFDTESSICLTEYGTSDNTDNIRYKVISICTHTGSSMRNGHYITVSKNWEDGNWYRFNDSIVMRDNSPSGNARGCYMLVLEREY